MKKILLPHLAAALLYVAPIHAAPLSKTAAPHFDDAAPRTLSATTLGKLRAILANPKLDSGFVGVEIRALGRVANPSQFAVKNYRGGAQPILFAQNATRRFLPASNVKLYTAALALRALGENKTFATTVASTRAPQDGELDGDLRIIGGGDPSLSSADIEALARQIAARGVRRIFGDVVGDGRAFGGETFGARYPDGWTLDDALWYYGPEISALAINRNQTDVTLAGAKNPGDAAVLQVSPTAPLYFRIVSKVVTAASTRAQTSGGSTGENGGLRFDRADENSALGATLSIRGTLLAGETQTEGVAVPAAPRWAAQLLRDALRKNGVVVDGIARAAAPKGSEYSQVDDSENAARFRADALPATQILARHDSAPLGVLLRRFLKNSDNLYGEMLLRDAALFGDATLRNGAPTGDFAARGHFMLRRFLAERKIAAAGLRFTDGSGLSRYDLLTPRANTQLLATLPTLRGGASVWNALPIAGVDGTLRKRMASTRASANVRAKNGTLRKRMASTRASANVRAKTGTFSIASALSGYVTTAGGDRLAVSILTNFCEGNAARAAQNEIFIALAESRR